MYNKDIFCPCADSNCICDLSIGICEGCPSGYYLSNNECITCKSPCRTCTSSWNCVACIDRYYK